MTVTELRNLFNTTFSLEAWPKTYEVDAETYGNVCNMVFQKALKIKINGEIRADIAVGPNYGIMFKNVELIVK